MQASGITRVEHIMGMPIVVDVRDVDDAAALEPLFDWFRLVDRTFSTYLADSEISRLIHVVSKTFSPADW